MGAIFIKIIKEGGSMEIKSIIVSVVLGMFTSTGVWTFVTFMIQRKDRKDGAVARMLKGLGHDRICSLATFYIARGSITMEEYESLHTYLFLPYIELGGDGIATRLMSEVDKLPIGNSGEVNAEELSQTAP